MTGKSGRAGGANDVLGPWDESPADVRKRALRILRSLKKAYPDAHVPLNYSSPLELMVATILSAQCTDKRVNDVTAPLFRKYREPIDWAGASQDVLEDEIRTTGFFRNKARAIRESTADLIDKHGGKVPNTIEELTALRGIGRKSANVLLAYAFDSQGIIVDTHFKRIARRLGMTAEMDPVKIEFELQVVVPKRRWSDFSLFVNWHGRETCYARKPECGRCAIAKDCPARESLGEITWNVKT
jgi:endonuclease-3